MIPHYSEGPVTLYHGDCLDVLRELPDASVDAVCTDPPYGLANTSAEQVAETIVRWVNGDRDFIPSGSGFMGKSWDAFVPPVAVWDECMRVLKPGGHLLAFAGSRTLDLMALGVRLAGFEIRDSIAWLYGSGFPKSLNVSKAIDATLVHGGSNSRRIRAANESRPGEGRVGSALPQNGIMNENVAEARITRDEPETDAARAWEGWGTALKPAHEPVVVARKPREVSEVWETIGSQLEAMEEWCRRRANGAGESSGPTLPDSLAVRTDSVRASAETLHADGAASRTATGAAAVSSDPTGTSVSGWTVETFWNTVTSWKACWAELSEAMSTSTTSTATSRTTDLRTLSSSMSLLTRSVTAQSTPDPGSWSSLAMAVDNLFAAGVLSLRSTLALSAHESATAATLTDSPEGDAAPTKPAFEPIVVARKPLQGTVAGNVLAYGTGALNIDASRVEHAGAADLAASKAKNPGRADTVTSDVYGAGRPLQSVNDAGRWPTNVVLDESQAEALDRQSGNRPTSKPGTVVKRASARGGARSESIGAESRGAGTVMVAYGDDGGASRFFPTFRYEAKAPSSERPKAGEVQHPTVKPLDLMRWLVRLVTPPGGVILEPFAGSGTTVEAAVLEGFECIAIEREADYLPLIVKRLSKPMQQSLFDDMEGDAA